MLFVGIVAMFGWGVALVEALSSLYSGYAASIIGAIIGAIWAFVDGFIAGVVIAWIYNLVANSSVESAPDAAVSLRPWLWVRLRPPPRPSLR